MGVSVRARARRWPWLWLRRCPYVDTELSRERMVVSASPRNWMTQRCLEWIRSAGCRAHGKVGEARRGGLRTVRLAEPWDRDLPIPTGALRFGRRTAFHLPRGAHVVTAQSPPLRRASPEVAVGSAARGEGRRSVWLSLEGLSKLPAGSRGHEPRGNRAPGMPEVGPRPAFGGPAWS